jgi:4-hydroxybenzoate polyprenyltransferase
MIGIQAGIGTVNDLVDVGRDRGAKPGKPLPHGVVSTAGAQALAALTIVAGLAMAVPSGPAATVVAASGLGVGLAYDFKLKGTAWSWLPFALGVPLLPVYAWLGSTGSVPSSFAVLIPAAVGAGAALAIANAIADLERDRSAGVGSVAIAIGPQTAWLVHAAIFMGVFGLAIGSLTMSANPGPLAQQVAIATVVIGGLIVGTGARLALSPLAERRERGWELEAVGVGVAAVGWIGGFAGVA